jgi:tetratricopeptide (TPR) repeat protein
MSLPKPNNLEMANQLIQKGKFDEALQIVIDLETSNKLNSEELLSSFLLKGYIYSLIGDPEKAIEFGELAYGLSQKLNKTSSSIDALLLKAQVFWFGKYEKTHKFIYEAEKRLDSLSEIPKSTYLRQKSTILYYKSQLSQSNPKKAFDLAFKSLELVDEVGDKRIMRPILSRLVTLSLDKGEYNLALEYATRNFEIQKEINYPINIARGLALLGMVYNYKGDFTKAIDYCKESLSIKEVRDDTKISAYAILGYIYTFKGEPSKALKNHERAINLAQKTNNKIQLAVNTMALGTVQSMRGESTKAIEHYQQAISLAEEIQSSFVIGMSLMNLVQIYSLGNFRKKAEQHLTRLEIVSSQNKGKQFSHMYRHAKAYFLYKSGRSRDRVEAEVLWKKIIDDRPSNPTIYITALGSLCSYLIEEMEMSNDQELLNEINPLIKRFMDIGEKTNSYATIAFTKYFQAKLALIQMDVENARILLTQAQRVAEFHDLNITATYLSVEHDSLLSKTDLWEKLKIDKAPISERVKLAAFDGAIDGMLGKGVIQAPELIDEEPILILITAEGGILLFSNTFTEDVGIEEELLSGFLTAFNDFSGELFSKNLDRAKFDDYTILMEKLGSFSISYLFKGQTFLAKQKLIQFIEKIEDNESILATLTRFYETSQVAEVKDIPILGNLLTEIFVPKARELSL